MVSTSLLLVLGIIFIILGWGTRHWIRRRQFYRTNSSGIEGFSSYGSMVGTRFMERMAWLIAGLFLLFGLFCLAGALLNRSAKPVQPKTQAHAHAG